MITFPPKSRNFDKTAKIEAHFLRVVRPIEVIPSDGALGASHISPDDEVCASKVLPDHHVLDSLQEHHKKNTES